MRRSRPIADDGMRRRPDLRIVGNVLRRIILHTVDTETPSCSAASETVSMDCESRKTSFTVSLRLSTSYHCVNHCSVEDSPLGPRRRGLGRHIGFAMISCRSSLLIPGSPQNGTVFRFATPCPIMRTVQVFALGCVRRRFCTNASGAGPRGSSKTRLSVREESLTSAACSR